MKSHFSLKNYNTFGIDVKANYFMEFSSIEELICIINNSDFQESRKLILGGGSNILFTDDFSGLVLLNKLKGKEIINEDADHVLIKAGAGEKWHDLVLFAIDKNFGGIENLSLIPGTVGAAPIQNIGAYGVELKDVFISLDAVNMTDGSTKTFSKEDCQFGYRNSVFKNELKGLYTITSVTLKLSKKPVFNITYGAIKATLEEMGIQEFSVKAVSDAVIHIRKSKLPDPAEIGNAGSFFKNPEISEGHFNLLKEKFPDIPSYPASPGKIKVPAGWLNEQCGWKGKRIGQAGVHKNQALVLVNYGGASGEELKKLSEEICNSVKSKFGIELETEVNII